MRMSQSRKDEVAIQAIKAAIINLLGPVIESIEAHTGFDRAGEPLFYVNVFLKSAGSKMTGTRLLDTIAAAATALRELDDDRFPYVTFLEPDANGAEDTRPAA